VRTNRNAALLPACYLTLAYGTGLGRWIAHEPDGNVVIGAAVADLIGRDRMNLTAS